MNIRRLNILPIILATFLLASCNMSRHVGSNDYVLRANQYKVATSDSTRVGSDIESALSGVRNYSIQKPNKRFLGIRAKMIAYCMSNPDSEKFPHKWLRKIGEAPVVINDNATQKTADQIVRLLDTKGCFNSQVEPEIKPRRGKNATMVYNIMPTQRYVIDEVTFHAETPEVNELLYTWQDESLIKVGDCYDQDNLTKERTRISTRLQGEGYFYSSPELVTFVVDTTYLQGKLAIEVKVGNPIVNGENKPLQTYRFDNIFIHPNSTSAPLSFERDYDTLDYEYQFSTRKATYKFIYDSVMTLNPSAISRALFIGSGMRYRPRGVKETYNSLLNLKNFKYIGIEFSESPNSTDSNRLIDATIRLQNNTRHKLNISFELSNMSPYGKDESDTNQSFLRNGNFGLETVLEYQNRNLFHGAEILKVDASFLVELPKLALLGESNDFHDIFSSFETGLSASLDIPQFLLPFTKKIVWQRARPHTMISLGADYQYRSYFERFLTNASFGYSWRHMQRVQHQLIPIELAFVRFFNLDDDFMNRLEGASDLRLKYQYSDHFVMDAKYNYIYSTQQFGSRSNFRYLNASVETAGNLLNGLSLLFDGPTDNNGIREVFGVPYSQYAKVSLDMKQYFYHGTSNTFVARLMTGVGIPYANSIALPYEKSFFGGGPSTMRAWQLRRLGPGHYQGAENPLERIGDISLVLNIEERFHIFGLFEGAAFVDAGNVWLMNQSADYPDGEWNWKSSWKDIAVGTGLGLRLNISILTIRFDFAIPLYDPGYKAGEAWRLPHWKFNQIVTNFGIDYPF